MYQAHHIATSNKKLVEKSIGEIFENISNIVRITVWLPSKKQGY